MIILHLRSELKSDAINSCRAPNVTLFLDTLINITGMNSVNCWVLAQYFLLITLPPVSISQKRDRSQSSFPEVLACNGVQNRIHQTVTPGEHRNDEGIYVAVIFIGNLNASGRYGLML